MAMNLLFVLNGFCLHWVSKKEKVMLTKLLFSSMEIEC